MSDFMTISNIRDAELSATYRLLLQTMRCMTRLLTRPHNEDLVA